MSVPRPVAPAALFVTALLAATLTGCTSTSGKQQPIPPTPPTSPAPPPAPKLLATDVTTTRGGHTVVFALDGQRWTTVALPHPPADATGIAAHGTDIYATDVDPTGIAVDSSHDGGKSWQRRHVVDAADAADLAGIDLALSPDGSKLAIMLDRPSSAGAVAAASVLVGPRFIPHEAPAAGQLAWWRDRLVLSGGALSSRFFLSDATGATWTPQPVTGSVAPAGDVDPNVATFGTATTRPDGTLLVPVTTHGRPPSVELYGGSGATFRRLVRVALGGDFGAGTTAVVAPRPDGSVIVAEATTPRLHIVDGDAQRSFVASGLPAPPLSLTFVTPAMGLAQVDVAGCARAKTGCTARHEVFTTADGGTSWTPAP